MTSAWTERTAVEIVQALREGQATAEEVALAFCDRIAAVEPQVAAFLHHDRDAVLQQARAIDARRAAGEAIGPLAGLPVAVKDILCTRDAPTTCGSKILDGYRPPYQATVMERLAAADAVILGRTNLDEFAMGSSTENSAYGPTRNPWSLEHVPGGSSGGSAAAVAARQAPVSVGTDTGGSVRQPAAYCGVVGLKPTYGRVSRYGLVAFASSLDQVGPMGRTVEDAALLLGAVAGHDPRDSTSAPEPVPDYLAELPKPLEGLRIGVVPSHFGKGLDAETQAAVQAGIDELSSAGATVREVDLPHAHFGIASYYLVATAEASSNLARYDGIHYGQRAANPSDLASLYAGSRGEYLGPEVKRRIMLGTFALSRGYRDAYYLKSLKVRRLIAQDYERAFQDVDLIVGPVTPAPAFRLGDKVDDPLAMYLTDIYTVGANLAGIPALSVPCGFTSDGRPIGFQLQGPPFSEALLLRAGHQYQQRTDWHTRRPALEGRVEGP